MKRSEVLEKLSGLLSTFDNSYPDQQQNRENAVTVLNLVESLGMLKESEDDNQESEDDNQLSFFDMDEL
jgi:hypothetical protein